MHTRRRRSGRGAGCGRPPAHPRRAAVRRLGRRLVGREHGVGLERQRRDGGPGHAARRGAVVGRALPAIRRAAGGVEARRGGQVGQQGQVERRSARQVASRRCSVRLHCRCWSNIAASLPSFALCPSPATRPDARPRSASSTVRRPAPRRPHQRPSPAASVFSSNTTSSSACGS